MLKMRSLAFFLVLTFQPVSAPLVLAGLASKKKSRTG